MDKNMNKKEWYVAKSTGQGLICDQENGKNIAVSYDPDDARLIAAAPELLEALTMFLHLDPRCHRGVVHCGECAACKASAAIEKATS